METVTVQPLKAATVAGIIWKIDPDQSRIGFSVKHMMFATVHGRFVGFRGMVRFDPDEPAGSEVEVEIDAASVDTGIKKRDDHLRSADFFDVATYPTILFRSGRVQLIPPGGHHRWLVVGDLTIHGVTRSVELNVEQSGESSKRHTGVIEFTATAKIRRSDFGMECNLPMDGGGLVVGDEVKITIAIQANSVRP